LIVAHDGQQIRQVLTNLIKNAVEAFEQSDFDNNTKKTIKLICHESDHHFFLGVADNGPGLPQNIEIEKLSEPYITHKIKGTGLGLAIVKKIVEDHQGELLFNPDISIINTMDFDYTTVIGFALPKDRL
jgi:two-component system nitrogen regulation sensor histidine kinase NtrY